MATKKSDKAPAKSARGTAKSTKSKAAPKAKAAPKKEPKAAKAPATPPKARHPRGRVLENHGSKEALAKSLAAVIARADEDTDMLEARLKKASNAQLLRLSRVTATVKQKYGSRDALITAIGNSAKKANDKDYLAKLQSFSLPQLLDLAAATERAARA
ncbi:MAG TPA: hypothetical protein VFQ53_28950 [Kofleriaceae bacterium]|nr:hypothetical protein [Kofleriaceae bacterium]